ncbi:MAG: hypothetical protein R6X13_04235 [bacterium]
MAGRKTGCTGRPLAFDFDDELSPLPSAVLDCQYDIGSARPVVSGIRGHQRLLLLIGDDEKSGRLDDFDKSAANLTN